MLPTSHKQAEQPKAYIVIYPSTKHVQLTCLRDLAALLTDGPLGGLWQLAGVKGIRASADTNACVLS